MKIKAYLAISEKGVHAHLIDQPGCFARGKNQDEAITNIPAIVRNFQENLARHGEDVEIPETIEVEILETNNRSSGPFDPGDTAALFEIEKQPISLAEVDRYVQLATYNREDLLSLAGDLPDYLLDWEPPGQGEFTIRHILRHIGSADKWYISRILQLENLPESWHADKDTPVFAFLHNSRDQTIGLLKNLPGEDLGGKVHFQTHFTSNPDEPWTLRKVLRRLLEHEREHIDHIQEMMGAWRNNLIARLAIERNNLIWELRGLSEADLTTQQLFSNWTAKDLLGHLAEWDQIHNNRLQALLQNRPEDVLDLKTEGFVEVENNRQHAAMQNKSLDQVLQELVSSRQTLLNTLKETPDSQLHCAFDLPDGSRLFPGEYLLKRARHDELHQADFFQWRENLNENPQSPRKSVLRLIVANTQTLLTSLMALIPDPEKTSKLITGTWCARDVIGHLADWEMIGVFYAKQHLDGKITSQMDEFKSDKIDEINAKFEEKRRKESWELAWSDYVNTREALLSLLDNCKEEALAEELVPPWGGSQSLYSFMIDWPWHDRQHAKFIQEEIGLPGL